MVMMAQEPNEIHVPGIGRIGHLQQWERYPNSWNAWVKWPGHQDEQVCWGGTQPWVIYMAARRYQELLMDDLEGAAGRMRTKDERHEFSERVYEVLACGRYMRDMLEEHYKLIRREAARIEQEAS